jgi:plastocyanin
VARGTTVSWQNSSGVAHDITPNNHSAWTAVNATGSGTVLEVTFSTAGTYDYSCTLHSGMTGRIVVNP